jgi:preprotein translocase subunit SecA
MFKKIAQMLGSNAQKKELQKYSDIAEKITLLEDTFEAYSDKELQLKTAEFRKRFAEGETLDDLLPEAFAAVREASKRTIGLRHYDIQLIGGMSLHDGKIAEMRTGEGKTLVATLPLYLNAIPEKGVHLITVNDYLARRDARWMAPIFNALGMTVGVLQMASRTNSGKSAFLVDLSGKSDSPHEDQHQLKMVLRKEAYKADITYGTNSEFGFDYLRDNLTMRLEDRSQRGHYYCIIDEVDNVLIDEARTPLIISGPAHDESEWYMRIAQVVRQLRDEDYEIEEKDRTVTLTEVGEAHVEELLDMQLRDPERPEDINPEQARVLGYLEQGLRAQFLFKRNKDYLVQGRKVVIVDEFTGRLMPGRRWSDGLHQAVEAKEGVKINSENITYATITLQNYYRMYTKLSGMTGTAITESEEFHKIYELDVMAMPTNLEYRVSLPDSKMVALEDRDGAGYKYTYYARKEDSSKAPLFYKRKDYTDVVFRSEEAKYRTIAVEIIHYYVQGRPQLIGTTSVEKSDLLSNRLRAQNVRLLSQVLLLRDVWKEQHGIEVIERKIPELEFLNKPLEELNVSELRPLARDLGVSLNLESDENLAILARIYAVRDEDIPFLKQVMQGGVSFNVLNAREHAKEGKIIAGAGKFRAVTFASNMAGRGVDIKLGGDLDEEILRNANRVLIRNGFDPFEMTNEDRLAALEKISEENYGIYGDSIKTFIQYMHEMEKVRELGGLHVIGSERHEARRIDDQLRGRAGRQGDPGSSRFYLSLEDDLMRLFGGAQVENLWKRMLIDESQPIELGLLGRIVEQSQERVEGSNFDVRKHLLEYDDVLNTQRQRIYAQRDRVFVKDDLSEDVMEMFQSELQKRVPEAFEDEEGPWRLLSYLNSVQPTIIFGSIIYPSFTYRLLIKHIRGQQSDGRIKTSQIKDILLDVAKRAVQIERDHVVRGIENMVEQIDANLDIQLKERYEAVDIFMEGLQDYEEEPGSEPRTPQSALVELSSLTRTPLRLSNQKLQRFFDADEDVAEELKEQIEANLMKITINRMLGSINRRVEGFEVRLNDIQDKDWDDIVDFVLLTVENMYEQRIERLLGEQGLIIRDLDQAVNAMNMDEISDGQLVQLLMLMTQGARLAFDDKTHRKVTKRYVRLQYVYLVAGFLAEMTTEEGSQQVLDHLQQALVATRQVRGLAMWDLRRRSETYLKNIDERLSGILIERLGQSVFDRLVDLPFSSFSPEEKIKTIDAMGYYAQNETYRQVLLRSISDQWVNYLTKVEALRVSVRMEAYAQRDPLVQYKSRAMEMFGDLLADIRMAVIARAFTYRLTNFDGIAEKTQQTVEKVVDQNEKVEEQETESKKRRRRKR